MSVTPAPHGPDGAEASGTVFSRYTTHSHTSPFLDPLTLTLVSGPYIPEREGMLRGIGSQCAEGRRFSRVAPRAGSDIGSRNAGRERVQGPADPTRPRWYARYRIYGAICGAVSGGGQVGRMAGPIPDVGVGVGTSGDDMADRDGSSGWMGRWSRGGRRRSCVDPHPALQHGGRQGDPGL